MQSYSIMDEATIPPTATIAPEDLRTCAETTMARAKFPMLATCGADGQPRLRPVSPVRTEGFTVYIANLKSYGKTSEIEANSKVELCYLDENHLQVRITGKAVIITDRPLLEEIWEANPLLRKYLGSIDNPELLVYRIEPNHVRYMVEWTLEYHEVPL